MEKAKWLLAAATVAVLIFGISLVVNAEGDNKDDPNSGKADQIGDGNSGQGNDDKDELISLRDSDPEQFKAKFKEKLMQLKEKDPAAFKETLRRFTAFRTAQKRFMLKHGDTNNDGTLDESERNALQEKQEELLDRWREEREKSGECTDISEVAEKIWEKRKANRDEIYEEVYDQERFDNADANDDGILDMDEIKAARKDFEYYKDGKRFQHADANNDGILSLEECKTEKQWEREHHREIEKKVVEDIKKRFPDYDPEKPEWIKNHPDELNTLAAHPYWVKEHSKTLHEIRQDKKWLENHPVVGGNMEKHWLRLDRCEDTWDRRENVRDRNENVRDRHEDVRDKREDIWDSKHDGGKKDKLEDKFDRAEDRRDKREDVRDRKENVRDRKENAWDNNHGWNDNFFKGKNKTPAPKHKPTPKRKK